MTGMHGVRKAAGSAAALEHPQEAGEAAPPQNCGGVPDAAVHSLPYGSTVRVDVCTGAAVQQGTTITVDTNQDPKAGGC